MPLAPAGGALMCSKHTQSKDIAAHDMQISFLSFLCDSCSADTFHFGSCTWDSIGVILGQILLDCLWLTSS